VDGDFGPEVTSMVASSAVHAWNRSAQKVIVGYSFNAQLLLRHFILFFYNIPSMGIGLPNIELFAGSGTAQQTYFLTGNQDISQEDNGRRNVALSFDGAVTPVLRFEFVFDNTDIDWLILSEILLCTDPIGPGMWWFIVYSHAVGCDTVLCRLVGRGACPELELSLQVGCQAASM
jgi:hypothetical protein